MPASSSRRKTAWPLRWEIALLIALKLVLLYIIWSLWFDHPMPEDERAANVSRIILNK